jgi:hypothetical protein
MADGDDEGLDWYRQPAAMTTLIDHPALAGVPTDLDGLRRVVQGLLLHRDWAPMYGVEGAAIRLDEQQLRSTGEVLRRAFELSGAPVTEPRAPIDRVLSICRHFTLLHTALLRAQGVPARVRCGFSGYFDPADPPKWYDHWITERWEPPGAAGAGAGRWVRDDPQVDELQIEAAGIDFDPYDQPPGRFLTGAEAWTAARAGDVDPARFGIFDMWGLAFIGGNVLHDLACLNKVELLPWDDGWGLLQGPHAAVPDDAAALLDEVAALVLADDVDAIRRRYVDDDRLRVSGDIVTFADGVPTPVHLDL